jgi:predicted DNA-binding protein with PD1-like motif
VRSTPVTAGRRILVVLEPGDEVLTSLAAACAEHGIRHAAVTTFLGAFTDVDLIGSSTPAVDPDLPMPDRTRVEHVEGTASGTVAPGADGHPVVHLHAAVGVKDRAAAGVVGHVLAATTHYTAEVLVEELLLEPGGEAVRRPDPRAHGIPTLHLR